MMWVVPFENPGGVYICTGLGFTGTCGYAIQPLDVCIDLASPWYDNISSFGPDPGATCFVRTAVTKPSGSLPTLEIELEGSGPAIPDYQLHVRVNPATHAQH
ncbi:hypothetical protein B0H11DRAFT_2229779 [Mycena galericulata]|nr:hypothetical protein B0H11DRAFT_2229779 [Mycena galericulata]